MSEQADSLYRRSGPSGSLFPESELDGCLLRLSLGSADDSD